MTISPNVGTHSSHRNRVGPHSGWKHLIDPPSPKASQRGVSQLVRRNPSTAVDALGKTVGRALYSDLMRPPKCSLPQNQSTIVAAQQIQVIQNQLRLASSYSKGFQLHIMPSRLQDFPGSLSHVSERAPLSRSRL